MRMSWKTNKKIIKFFISLTMVVFCELLLLLLLLSVDPQTNISIQTD